MIPFPNSSSFSNPIPFSAQRPAFDVDKCLYSNIELEAFLRSSPSSMPQEIIQKLTQMTSFYQPNSARQTKYETQIRPQLGAIFLEIARQHYYHSSVSTSSSSNEEQELKKWIGQFFSVLIQSAATDLKTDCMIVYHLVRADLARNQSLLNLVVARDLGGRLVLNTVSLGATLIYDPSNTFFLNRESRPAQEVIQRLWKGLVLQRSRLFNVMVLIFEGSSEESYSRSNKIKALQRSLFQKEVLKNLWGNYTKLDKLALDRQEKLQIRLSSEALERTTLLLIKNILKQCGSLFTRQELYSKLKPSEVLQYFDQRLMKSNLEIDLVKIIQEVVLALLPISESIAVSKLEVAAQAEKATVARLWKNGGLENQIGNTKALGMLPFRQLLKHVKLLFDSERPIRNPSSQQSLASDVKVLQRCLKMTADIWPEWLELYLAPGPLRQSQEMEKLKALLAISMLKEFTKNEYEKVRFAHMAWIGQESGEPSERGPSSGNMAQRMRNPDFSNIHRFAFNLNDFSDTLAILSFLLPEDDSRCVEAMFQAINLKERRIQQEVVMSLNMNARSLRRYITHPLRLALREPTQRTGSGASHETLQVHIRFVCRCIRAFARSVEKFETYMFQQTDPESEGEESEDQNNRNHSPQHIRNLVKMLPTKGTNFIVALLNILFFAQSKSPSICTQIFTAVNSLLESNIYRQATILAINIVFGVLNPSPNPLDGMYRLLTKIYSQGGDQEAAELRSVVLKHLRVILSGDWAYSVFTLETQINQQQALQSHYYMQSSALRKLTNGELCSLEELCLLGRTNTSTNSMLLNFQCSYNWVRMALQTLSLRLSNTITSCPDSLAVVNLILQRYLAFSPNPPVFDKEIMLDFNDLQQAQGITHQLVVHMLRVNPYDSSSRVNMVSKPIFGLVNAMLANVGGVSASSSGQASVEQAITQALELISTVLQLLISRNEATSSGLLQPNLIRDNDPLRVTIVSSLKSLFEPSKVFHYMQEPKSLGTFSRLNSQDLFETSGKINVVMAIAVLVGAEESEAKLKYSSRKSNHEQYERFDGLRHQYFRKSNIQYNHIEERCIRMAISRLDREMLASGLKKPMFKTYQSKTTIRICALRVLTLLARFFQDSKKLKDKHYFQNQAIRVNDPNTSFKSTTAPTASFFSSPQISILECLNKPDLHGSKSSNNNSSSLLRLQRSSMNWENGVQEFLSQVLVLAVDGGANQQAQSAVFMSRYRKNPMMSAIQSSRQLVGTILDLINTLINYEPLTLKYLLDHERKSFSPPTGSLSSGGFLQNLLQKIISSSTENLHLIAPRLRQKNFVHQRLNVYWFIQKHVCLVHQIVKSPTTSQQQAAKLLGMMGKFYPLQIIEGLLLDPNSGRDLPQPSTIQEIDGKPRASVLSIPDQLLLYEESLRMWCLEAALDLMVASLFCGSPNFGVYQTKAYFMLTDSTLVRQLLQLSRVSKSNASVFNFRSDMLILRNLAAEVPPLEQHEQQSHFSKPKVCKGLLFADVDIYGYGRLFGYDSLQLFALTNNVDKAAESHLVCMQLTYESAQQNLLIAWSRFFTVFSNIGKSGYSFSNEVLVPKWLSDNYHQLDILDKILGPKEFRLLNSGQLCSNFSVYKVLAEPSSPEYKASVERWDETVIALIEAALHRNPAQPQRFQAIKYDSLQCALTVALVSSNRNKLAYFLDRILSEVLLAYHNTQSQLVSRNQTKPQDVFQSTSGVLLLYTCAQLYQRCNKSIQKTAVARKTLVLMVLDTYLSRSHEFQQNLYLPFLWLADLQATDERQTVQRCLGVALSKMLRGSYADLVYGFHFLIWLCTQEQASLIDSNVIDSEKLYQLWGRVCQLNYPLQKQVAQRGLLTFLEGLAACAENYFHESLCLTGLKMLENPLSNNTLRLRLHSSGSVTLKGLQQAQKIMVLTLLCHHKGLGDSYQKGAGGKVRHRDQLNRWFTEDFFVTVVNDSLFANWSLLSGFVPSQQQKALKNIFIGAEEAFSLRPGAPVHSLRIQPQQPHLIGTTNANEPGKTNLFDFLCKVQMLSTLNAYLILCKAFFQNTPQSPGPSLANSVNTSFMSTASSNKYSSVYSTSNNRGNRAAPPDLLCKHMDNLDQIFSWMKNTFRVISRQDRELEALLRLRNNLYLGSTEQALSHMYSNGWVTNSFLDRKGYFTLLASSWACLLSTLQALLSYIRRVLSYSEECKEIQRRISEGLRGLRSQFREQLNQEAVQMHLVNLQTNIL